VTSLDQQILLFLLDADDPFFFFFFYLLCQRLKEINKSVGEMAEKLRKSSISDRPPKVRFSLFFLPFPIDGLKQISDVLLEAPVHLFLIFSGALLLRLRNSVARLSPVLSPV